jgi:NADH dehydrogenase FAD-containing subunit
MKKRLVLAGGGHAHMVTLANLRRIVDGGHTVTVIQPSEHHYYSGMGPGMLGGTYRAEEIRFATRRQVEALGGTFVLGRVVRIDARAQSVQLEGGDTLPYDVLSCNLGSYVPSQMITSGLEDIYPVKPIERLMEAQARILELGAQGSISVGIVGGGPSAAEIAGNVWRLTRRPGMAPARIKIITGNILMPRHPEGVRRRVLRSLVKRGIEVIESRYIQEISTGKVVESSGKTHALDMIFDAVGVRPSDVFRSSGLPIGPDGGLLVNRYLQSTEYNNIFGGGDCIYFQESPLDKVGVYAVRQNPVLFHNLMAALDGGELQVFDPRGDYLLIFNLGDGTGVFYKKPLLFGGRIAFTIKDYIDRKFMRRFQNSTQAKE